MRPVVVFAIFVAVLAAGAPKPVLGESPLGILIPAYIPIETDLAAYNTLTTSASTLGSRLWIIINMHNGPLDNTYSHYSEYVSFISAARGYGAKVLGYVYTLQGDRSISDVNRDVDKWYDYYTIDGIFFDEASALDSKYYAYNNYQAYVKTKASAVGQTAPKIVLNPGVSYESQGSDYTMISDVIVIKEDYESEYSSWTSPTWVKSYANTKFSIMAHTSSAWGCVIHAAQSNNAYYMYATDHNIDGNPYSGLPSYWSDLVAAVSSNLEYDATCASSTSTAATAAPAVLVALAVAITAVGLS